MNRKNIILRNLVRKLKKARLRIVKLKIARLKIARLRIAKLSILNFLAMVLLSGCGVYKGSFDCKVGKSIGCESVSKVNELVNEDSLDDYVDEINESKSKKKSKKNKGNEGDGDCGCNKCKVRDKNFIKNENNTNGEDIKEDKIKIYFGEIEDKGKKIKYGETEIEVGVR